MFTRAIFLDKDGTLIENVPYNADPSKIKVVDGAVDALKSAQAAGYQVFIISNQSGVALGLFKEQALAAVEEQLRQLLGEHGITLSGFYYCPHHPDGSVPRYAISCFCRKPNPGLIFQAGREHGINLGKSWFIGDILHDIEAGRRADCRTVLINNGGETEWDLSPLRRPHFTVANLADAIKVILTADNVSTQGVASSHPSIYGSSPAYLPGSQS